MFINSDGTQQTAKVMRKPYNLDCFVGDGQHLTVFMPVGNLPVRESAVSGAEALETQAHEKLNRARFLRAAVELFDEEVREASEARDKALAVILHNTFEGSTTDAWEKFDDLFLRNDWLKVAQAARKHLESEAAGE